MSFYINITDMSMKNGILGLPIDVCRNWNALNAVSGKFVYAGRESDITFTPKHIDIMKETATAWQFTVKDSVQFAQLRMDGVFTYAEGKEAKTGKNEWMEKLECDLADQGNVHILKVNKVIKQPETNALRKLRALLKQGIRPESIEVSKAPEWNAPSGWIDMAEIEEYKDVTDCLYIWYGKAENDTTVYLYVGIVGDTKRAGKSKRCLSQRLKEEQKDVYKRYGKNIAIQQFRFCSLNNAHGYSVPELLKTIEMSEITIMTSLFNCDNARSNIDALFKDKDVILLNSSTSYKYVR